MKLLRYRKKIQGSLLAKYGQMWEEYIFWFGEIIKIKALLQDFVLDLATGSTFEIVNLGVNYWNIVWYIRKGRIQVVVVMSCTAPIK